MKSISLLMNTFNSQSNYLRVADVVCNLQLHNGLGFFLIQLKKNILNTQNRCLGDIYFKTGLPIVFKIIL